MSVRKRLAVFGDGVLSDQWRSFALWDLGRTLILFAELTVVGLTPLMYLQAPVGGVDAEKQCSNNLLFWNVLCSPLPDQWSRSIIIVLLLVAISGVSILASGVIGWYVAISLNTGLTHVDGGEAVAVVASIWIMLASLGDPRASIWKFQYGNKLHLVLPRFRSSLSSAAVFALKVQCSIVYAHAAISKLFTDQWLDGSAIYYVARMELFGVTGFIGEIIKKCDHGSMDRAWDELWHIGY